MEKMKLFFEVLDSHRASLLDAFTSLKNRFYLAGGTSLALQIGHRTSDDFDFFTDLEFSNQMLLKELKALFPQKNLSLLQDDKDTLTILINNEIKLSFFKLDYKNYLDLLESKNFRLAQVLEIAVMKILALPRAVYKDYVDLYFILQFFKLSDIIELAKKKHPEFNESVYLKCLLSYDDIDMMPIMFIEGKERSSENIFEFLKTQTLDFIETKL